MTPNTLQSWLAVHADSDFSIHNIPFGIFSRGSEKRTTASAIGHWVVDLAELHRLGLLNDLQIGADEFNAETLNPMIGRGKEATRQLRLRLQELLSTENRDTQQAVQLALVPLAEVSMHLPIHIGDYTDFYSSEDHARNVGTMFRDPANALLPNWKHLPVAYHGRASSIVVSGTPVRRPWGQLKPNDTEPPIFAPSRQLDFELEMAFITFDGVPMGQRITTAMADEHIFGFVLFNDWSARDIQKWEYVPLGPFLSKNFASTMSPWVVTLDALEPFRQAGPAQDPAVLPYLEQINHHHINIELSVAIAPANAPETIVSRSNYKHLYWSYAQQLAHHTVGGCPVRAGDLMASGTISGPTQNSFGSMLELAWKGTKPVALADGTTRTFIADGDTVTLRGHCQQNGIRIGFGEAAALVLPSHTA